MDSTEQLKRMFGMSSSGDTNSSVGMNKEAVRALYEVERVKILKQLTQRISDATPGTDLQKETTIFICEQIALVKAMIKAKR